MSKLDIQLEQVNKKIDLMNACDLSDLGCGDQDYFTEELTQLEEEKENIINKIGEYNEYI